MITPCAISACRDPPHAGLRARGKGFTILELMVTVSLAAILLAVGVPALQEFGARQRMSAAMHALHGQLALARDTAIRTGFAVVACPGTPASGCREDSDWSGGWLVFDDANGDAEYESGEILHRVEPGLEQIVIRTTAGRRSLRFAPNGSAPGSNGTITFCDWRGPTAARKLVLANTGRIRREEAPDTDPRNCPGRAP